MGRGRRAALLLAALVIVAVAVPVSAEPFELGATHPWLPWPDVWDKGHPLAPVLSSVLSQEWWRQPDWKLPMLVNGLRKQPQQCRITAYCSQCCDGGGRWTRWGSRVRRGICAADPDYWGPGSVVWIGPPVNEVCIVEDTGSAIQGPHRFDVCMEGNHAMCIRIGVSRTIYVPLHRVPPTGCWGDKPHDWEPPVWAHAPAQAGGS